MAVNLHYYALDANGTFSHASDEGSFRDPHGEYKYDLFNLVVLGVFGSIVNVSGAILTLFILITLSRMHPKSAAMILLLGVGYSDLVILFLGQILFFLPRAFGFMESMVAYVSFVDVDYRYLYPIMDCALIVNAWLIVALATERYIVIAHPARRATLLARRRVFLAMGILVGVAFLFDLPKFFEYHTITHHHVNRGSRKLDGGRGDRHIRIEGSPLHDNRAFQWVYMFALDLLVRLIVPLILVLTLFVLLVKGLKRFKSSHETSSMKVKAKAEMTARVTLMTLALMTSFMLVQIPFLLVTVLHVSLDESQDHPHYAKFVNAALFLQATNSAIKFYIYFFMSANFQSELKKNLCCCPQGKGDEDEEDEKRRANDIEEIVDESRERALPTIQE